jgi:DNA-binding transcriptional ArsR family regulator
MMDQVAAEINRKAEPPGGAEVEVSTRKGERREPHLAWDFGTAYDFFISLHVLHQPDEFGLRPSWAAGVRSRLGADDRKTLEEASEVVGTPLAWVHSLAEPKDGASLLWALRHTPADQRLATLNYACINENEKEKALRDALREISSRRSWDANDLEAVGEMIRKLHHKTKDESLPRLLDIWANPEGFGERYLAALQSYYQVFFAEEEAHLLPHLRAALERAQKLAEKMGVQELIEHLSQGVHIEAFEDDQELVLTPSYWGTPLIFFDSLGGQRTLIAFGARPVSASLVPGELVPDALLQILKAMADPTRLRILHYLANEPLSPAEISRRLRLRPPTVTHHLSALRLAGLVHLRIEEKDERLYSARLEALEGLQKQLLEFLLTQTEGGATD